MTAAALPLVFLGLVLTRQNLILTLAVVVGLYPIWFADRAIEFLVQDLWFTVDREVLLSLPMFIFAGMIMSRGGIAERLVRIMSALTSSIPGGLGIATVLSLALFSAIAGAAVVTMMAIGSLMYPALIRNGYSRSYALGVLCAGGTLGIIIPPSILMVLYGIATEVPVTDMFKAGWGPGLLMVVVLSIYTWATNRTMKTEPFDGAKLAAALKSGIWAILMPVILLGGIYSGYFTVTEAAAVSLLYAFLVEIFLHRELKLTELKDIALETVKLLGGLLPILAFAGSLNTVLDYQGVPQQLVEWAQTYMQSTWQLLLMVNLLLLVAGALMDEGSAIVIFAPLLAPMGAAFGLDPIHFAMIVIVNLQIGYVCPPMAINVIVATMVFRESFGTVCRAVLPFIALMLLVLLATILVPQLSLYLVGR